MKKIYQLCAATAAIFTLLPACQKEMGENFNENNGEQISIEATLSESIPDTKITASPISEGGLALAWESTDQIRVVGTTNKVFSIQEGYTEHNATFVGTRVEGETFDIIYPSRYAETKFVKGREYTGQVQSGNNNTAHLEYNALLEGVSTYEQISFSADWAAANGGNFYQNGAILFHLQLPNTLNKVTKINLSSGAENIFFTSNSESSATNILSLTLDTVDISSDHILKAYMMTSWQPIVFGASSQLTIDVYDNENNYYSKSFTPGAKTINGGYLNEIKLNNSNWIQKNNTKGSGTAESPYKLETVEDLLNMKSQLIKYETVYFSLENDIDMASIDNWTPLNNGDPDYDRYIDFEGNGHVIKNLKCSEKPYASFFGVLHGHCRNVGFVNANVQSTNAGGIIAGYLGLRKPANDSNIGIVENCFTTGSIYGNPGGGIAGYMGAPSGEKHCAIRDSYSTANVSGKAIGGIAGGMIGKCEITNAYSAGMVRSETGYAAGAVCTKENIADAAVLLTNAVAWNPCVVGGKDMSLRSMYDITEKGVANDGENILTYKETAYPKTLDIASTDNYSSKTAAELQAIFTANENWSATLFSGYPILKWMEDRTDKEEICGFANIAKAFESGDGSQNNPYTLAYDYQLYNIDRVMQEAGDSVVTYFKLNDNLDMAKIHNWPGINNVNPYMKAIHLEGNNKTINNLTLTGTDCYKGFFGILFGTVQNLTFNNASLTTSKNTAGIIAAWAGLNSEVIEAHLNNVHVTNGSVSNSADQPTGGFIGKSSVVTLNNCSYQGSVERTYLTSTTANQGTGGLIGYSKYTRVEDCSFNGTLKGGRLTGGIIGYANGGSKLFRSQTQGSISASAINSIKPDGVGGIVGWWGNNLTDSIAFCSSSATIALEGTVASNTSGAGGIAGLAGGNGKYITNCSFTGSLKGQINVGGICGYPECASAIINQCWVNANITSMANGVGGIVGSTKTGTSATPVTISNCYSKGALLCGSQVGGGIVGEMYPYCNLSNCYSTMTIDGQRVLGGIVGRAANAKWAETAVCGDVITKCIAWNPHIITTDKRDATAAGGSGCIVGFTAVTNTMSKGYRLSTMIFEPSDASFTAVDQEDCDGTNWAKGTTPGTGKTYQVPYHGKAAAANATVSSVASTLGWDTNIWDLSGSLPTLKNNAE